MVVRPSSRYIVCTRGVCASEGGSSGLSRETDLLRAMYAGACASDGG